MSNEQNTPIDTPAENITLYKLHIELIGTKVPIWRNIIVPSNTPLYMLHGAIQFAMGWNCTFRHKFVIGKKHIHGSMGWNNSDKNDYEEDVPLDTVLEGKKKFTYIYGGDIGEAWKHQVTVVRTDCRDDYSLPHLYYVPYCVSGEGTRPPDEIDGPEAYNEICDILNGPNCPDKKIYRKWLKDNNYPTPRNYPPKFNLKDANESLRIVARMFGFGDESEEEKFSSDWYNDWNNEQGNFNNEFDNTELKDSLFSAFPKSFETNMLTALDQNWEDLDEIEFTEELLKLFMPQQSYSTEDLQLYLQENPEFSEMIQIVKQMQNEKREQGTSRISESIQGKTQMPDSQQSTTKKKRTAAKKSTKPKE